MLGFVLCQLDFLNRMLRVALCADGDAEIGNGLPFVEFGIFLQNVFLINGTNSAMKIAF